MKEKEVKEVQREYPKGLLKDYNEVFKEAETIKQSEKEEKLNESINISTLDNQTISHDFTIESESFLEIIKPIETNEIKKENEKTNREFYKEKHKEHINNEEPYYNSYIVNNYCIIS
jgi:hypothetical protein